MNVDDIKNIWKKDMDALEHRVKVNEEKIKALEFNKAKTGFDTLLKVSIAGKNMALVYAVISLCMIYFVSDSIPYILMLVVASGAMVFSYFQHSVLKKIDYGKLSLIQLQKEIAKFRIHTSRTAIYDMSIVAIWLCVAGLSFLKWGKGFDVFQTPEKLSHSAIVFGIMLIVIVFFSKAIYKDYDKKLKKHEADLDVLATYQDQ
ncbi:hypothetical protein [uncultured Dokdonia sp.]|uniref:hypothetical protein n=1 Tax=uncultured Dokdonia sp. TaxID=575653 RepID=UPI002632966A|nr:hypothetical protein [uncultured Dokdonia sp.]